MNIIVGTRGSKLALRQTNWVISQLKEKYPKHCYKIKMIRTTGDKIQNISLDKIGEKGVFVKEIEEQLLNGEIDLAVHSMKDMPGELPRGLMFSWTPRREDFRDALILNKGYQSLEDLPKGAIIATGSKRRACQLLSIREDLNVISIRGNMDTRLRKMKEKNLDGIILAMAGLKRMGFSEIYKEQIQILSPQIMLPSPTQGALGLEIREDNDKLHNLLECIRDDQSHLEIIAERAFLKGIGGSCHIPMGALCTIREKNLQIEGLLGNEDGTILIRKKIYGDKNKAKDLGKQLAKEILKEMKVNER
ncbi:hydroxymethylbilane synthase [Garciella nitratireducens]|uniref:Porphobilinogen deaminase n=1 Tax=Garciella nitratireducens DSM 15102 TaxID=1121911 RepID=A0A1T4KJ60_9FIRM|nr:hydroxymethylbilane synthase [Garciella nitratireducens]SJZ42405.1 hydroxymethylbilane synthase [Garciella nitratireducens DSM 15102]